jgi:hypothetical protein
MPVYQTCDIYRGVSRGLHGRKRGNKRAGDSRLQTATAMAYMGSAGHALLVHPSAALFA